MTDEAWDRNGEARWGERSSRFGALERLYGVQESRWIRGLHICVVGIGGVGSWSVEALARSGVGSITMVDGDTIEPGNVNRQIHALTDRFEHAKTGAMAERILGINPHCEVHEIRDFLTDRTLEDYLGRGYDHVIDAIDSVRFKAAMIALCRRRKIPIVTTGGAGGRRNPLGVRVTDLSRTEHDALAARVRRRLRDLYGFSRNPKRRFGVECVHSTEQPLYPRPDGTVGREKPGIQGVSLDCRFGYGSSCLVTATFGFVAASRALDRSLARLRKGLA